MGWYAWVGGKLKRLCDPGCTKTEAWDVLRKLQVEPADAAPPPGDTPAAESPDATVLSLCDEFVHHIRTTLPKERQDFHVRYVIAFAREFQDLPFRDLRKFHLTRFLHQHGGKWAPKTQAHAVGCISTALNWCLDQGFIAANPLAGYKKPKKAARRRRTLTPDQESRIAEAVIPEFREFLAVMRLTGMRPGEVAKLTARDCDFATRRIVLEQHKTASSTGEVRMIPMPDDVLGICRRLAELHPDGPLLRNRRGRPWWVAAVPQALRRFIERFWMIGSASDPGLHDELRTALREAAPDFETLVLTLFGWYGSGSGLMTGYPVYEDVPGELLRQRPTEALVRVLASRPLTPEQRLGAVRLFAGWSFRERLRRDRAFLSAELTCDWHPNTGAPGRLETGAP